MQLAVIAKEPTPGRVKTRLCPPCTPLEAARLAEAALADTLGVVRSTPAERHVLVLDGRPARWLPDGFDVVAQRGAGLADRLAAAFADCFAGAAGPVVLVGMDTPQLERRSLERAGDALRPRADGSRRAVLGRALDGGWWLLGLSQPCAAAFDGVPMSEPTTGADQLRRLRQCRFDVVLGDPARDVDTFADAAAVAARAPATAFASSFRQVAARLGRHPDAEAERLGGRSGGRRR